VFPIGICHDVAGVVEAVGSEVKKFAVGDKVFCRKAEVGSYAEYCLIGEDITAKMHPSMTFSEAAGVPLAGMTALQALRAAGIKQGDSVFISGGAGGVGSFAIQLAKHHFGASKVTVTCSKAKEEVCKSLGADEVIDYTARKGHVYDNLSKYDVVFDTVGDSVQMAKLIKPGHSWFLLLLLLLLCGGNKYQCMKRTNTLKNSKKAIASVVNLDSDMAPNAGFAIKLFLDILGAHAHFSARWNGGHFKCVRLELKAADLELLGGLVGDKKIRCLVDSTFHGLDDFRKAFERAENGRPVGKVIIEI